MTTTIRQTTSLNVDNPQNNEKWRPQTVAEFNTWFKTAISTTTLLEDLKQMPQWVHHIRQIVASGTAPQKKTPTKKKITCAKDHAVWKAIPTNVRLKPLYDDPELFKNQLVRDWVLNLDLKSWNITDDTGAPKEVDDVQIEEVIHHALAYFRATRHKLREDVCNAAWKHSWGPKEAPVPRTNYQEYFTTPEGEDQLLVWIVTKVLNTTPNAAGKSEVTKYMLSFVRDNMIRLGNAASLENAKASLAESRSKEHKDGISGGVDALAMSDSMSVATEHGDEASTSSAQPIVVDQLPEPPVQAENKKASPKKKNARTKNAPKNSQAKRGRPSKKK